MPLNEKTIKDRTFVLQKDLFTKVVDYENYRSHGCFTHYDTSVTKRLTNIKL